MLKTLQDKKAGWLSGDGPNSGSVLCSYCTLSRNLADFPFPAKCSDDEKTTVEERILSITETDRSFTGWRYFPFKEMSRDELRFLVECRITGNDVARANGSRGVLVSEDHTLSLSINGEDHICIRAMSSGLQLNEVWKKIAHIEEKLSHELDFAFDERLGYLTASIYDVGTTLKAGAIAHLPGMLMTNEFNAVQKDCSKLYSITPMFRKLSSCQSPLQKIENIATLGRSEEEIIFHLKQLILEIIQKEKNSIAKFRLEAPSHIEDDVGRALGLARGAHLVAFEEAIFILSALRTGINLEILKDYTFRQINELLIGSQHAHVKLRIDGDCDERTLNMERASLFRSAFS